MAILLPFEYLPSFSLSQFTIRPSVLVGLALIATAAMRFLRGRLKVAQLSWPHYLLVVWLTWLGTGLLYGGNSASGLKILVPLTFLVAVAVSISLLVKREYVRSIVYGILAGAALSIIFGLLQFIGNIAGLPESLTGLRPEYGWQGFGFPRLQSVALEPLYFSCFLLLPTALLSSLMIYRIEYRRWPFIALFAACLVANFLTLSRGGLAAMIVMLIVLVVVARRQLSVKKHLKKIVLFAVAGIGMLVVVALTIGVVARPGQDSDLTYGTKGTATLLSHLTNVGFFADDENVERDDSIAQRDTARAQAFTVLGENPKVLLIGTGIGQYETFVNKNYPGIYAAPNNVILEQLVQTGIVGIALLSSFTLLILYRLALRIIRYSDQLQYLAVALFVYLVAVGIQAQTFTGLGLTHLWFGVGIALFLIHLKKVTLKNKNHEVSTAKKRPKA